MVTQIIQDTDLWTGKEIISIVAGTSIRFLDFSQGSHPSYPRKPEMAEVELPGGTVGIVPAQAVGSGINSPEESLKRLERLTGISQRVLTNAASDGRLIARKSAGVWLSTEMAVEYAIEQGRIRAPKEKGV